MDLIIEWKNTHLENAVSNIEASIVNLLKLRKNLDDLNNRLFLSISKGEYYKKDIEESLNEIKNSFLDKVNTNGRPSIYLKKVTLLKQIEFYLNFIQSIKFSIDKGEDVYKKSELELNYTFNNHGFIFEQEKNSQELFKWLFVVNIKISNFDEGYVVNQINIEKLSEIYFLLDELDYNSTAAYDTIIKKTKLRVAILLLKLFKRKIKTNTKKAIFSNQIDYTDLLQIDNDYYLENINEKLNELENFIKSQKCESIIKLIEKHYFVKYTIEETIEEVSQRLIDKKLRVIDVVKFTKTSRKNEINNKILLKKVENIKNDILKYYEDKSVNYHSDFYLNKVNEYPFYLVLEHIKNLELKLFCDKKLNQLSRNFNFNLFVKVYQEIKNEYLNTENQLNTNDKKEKSIKFPSFVLKETLKISILKLLEIVNSQSVNVLNDKEYDFYNKTREVFDFCYDISNSIEKAISFWEENRLMPLYIEIEDCNDLDIFLDSYYVLPSDYNKVIEESKKSLKNLKKLESIFFQLIPNSIREEYTKVFKQEVKENQYNVITILGLFAAFISYVLSNVTIYKSLKDEDISAVFSFMLIFGVVLFFFVASLKLLFSAEKSFKFPILNFKINYIIPWLIFGISITIYSFRIIKDYKKDEIKFLKFEIKRLDSIQKNKTLMIEDMK